MSFFSNILKKFQNKTLITKFVHCCKESTPFLNIFIIVRKVQWSWHNYVSFTSDHLQHRQPGSCISFHLYFMSFFPQKSDTYLPAITGKGKILLLSCDQIASSIMGQRRCYIIFICNRGMLLVTCGWFSSLYFHPKIMWFLIPYILQTMVSQVRPVSIVALFLTFARNFDVVIM